MASSSTSITLAVRSADTFSERRFPLSLSVGALKDKLEQVTGIRPAAQVLQLQRGHVNPFASSAPPAPTASSSTAGVELSDESQTLGSYGAEDGWTLQVTSNDPTDKATAGQFTDVSQVEKYELPLDEYASRSDTVLAFKQRNKLGRFADSPSPSSSGAAATEPSASTDAAQSDLVPGARCEISSPASLPRRGTIRYVGPTEFAAGGDWVGVELDEPLGRGDGEVDGKRYFGPVGAKRAGFYRPDRVTVGDFEVVDEFADLEDEEM